MIEPVILEGYFYTEEQEGGYAEDATFFTTDERYDGHYAQTEQNLARLVQSVFTLKHDYERSPNVRVTIEVIDRTASST